MPTIANRMSQRPIILVGAMLLVYMTYQNHRLSNHICYNKQHKNSYNSTYVSVMLEYYFNRMLNRTKSDPLVTAVSLVPAHTTGLAIPQRSTQNKQTGKYNNTMPLMPGNLSRSTDEANQRPELCSNCFKRPYIFTLNSPEVCAGLTSSLTILILITTTHAQKDRRQAIRTTWGTLTRKNTHQDVRYAFLLGSKSVKADRALMPERDEYKDLLMQNFTDSYRNLTLKTLMAFEWAERFCPAAQYIMKTDNDVYTHIPNILRLVNSRKPGNEVLGACHLTAGPIRYKGSKYYASVRDYAKKTYPGYCSGTGYVIPRKMASEVLRVSPSIPFFFLEDVYVSLCVNRLKYKLVRVPGFMSSPSMGSNSTCGGFRSNALYTIHEVKPENVRKIWSRCPQVFT